MHNIAVLLDRDGHYHYCPVFDNGCALLSDTQMDYPMGEDIITLIPQVRAKTLSRNFMEQLEAVEALYGQSLKFSYSIKEIEMLLEKEPIIRKKLKYGYGTSCCSSVAHISIYFGKTGKEAGSHEDPLITGKENECEYGRPGARGPAGFYGADRRDPSVPAGLVLWGGEEAVGLQRQDRRAEL